MNEYLFSLVNKYKDKGVLIDTNLLLLYLVGSLDLNLIRNFKRTAFFTEDDFELVSEFIKNFDQTITTPHILTEVSDFIDNREKLQAVLKIYIETTKEIFIDSIKLSKKDTFLKFGLADTSVTYSAETNYLIYTDDRPLYGFLIHSGIEAVNLDEIRIV